MQRRRITRYAYVPTLLHNGRIIWFKEYYAYQELLNNKWKTVYSTFTDKNEPDELNNNSIT